MARAPALVFTLLVAFACDGKFEFDTETPLNTGGSGGSGGSVATGGVISTGGVTSSDSACEARCRAAQLTCLQSRQECVECTSHSDCAARGGGRCGSSGAIANRCVECLDDDDCQDGQECDFGTHSCVTSCTRFGDTLCAGTGLECNPFLGYCAACFDADDCDDVRLMCSDGDARCVQCVDSDECAFQIGEFCDPVLLTCVVCRDSDDCAGSQTCDPVAHVCH